MKKALWMTWVGVAFLLALPGSGAALDLCSADATVTAAPTPGTDFLLTVFEPVPAQATACTKEVCSVARWDCQQGCLPCGFTFRCLAPSCQGPCQCQC